MTTRVQLRTRPQYAGRLVADVDSQRVRVRWDDGLVSEVRKEALAIEPPNPATRCRECDIHGIDENGEICSTCKGTTRLNDNQEPVI